MLLIQLEALMLAAPVYSSGGGMASILANLSGLVIANTGE